MPQQRIASELAQLYKTRLGRGPVRVQVVIARDVVLCTLEQVDTPYEETLLEAGASDGVHEARLRFQRHLAPRMIAVVAAAVDREVRGYIPGYNAELGVATETFLLVDQEPTETLAGG